MPTSSQLTSNEGGGSSQGAMQTGSALYSFYTFLRGSTTIQLPAFARAAEGCCEGYQRQQSENLLMYVQEGLCKDRAADWGVAGASVYLWRE